MDVYLFRFVLTDIFFSETLKYFLFFYLKEHDTSTIPFLSENFIKKIVAIYKIMIIVVASLLWLMKHFETPPICHFYTLPKWQISLCREKDKMKTVLK